MTAVCVRCGRDRTTPGCLRSLRTVDGTGEWQTVHPDPAPTPDDDDTTRSVRRLALGTRGAPNLTTAVEYLADKLAREGWTRPDVDQATSPQRPVWVTAAMLKESAADLARVLHEACYDHENGGENGAVDFWADTVDGGMLADAALAWFAAHGATQPLPPPFTAEQIADAIREART